MKLSISITDFSWPSGTAAMRDELVRVGRAADDAGLDTLWVADHLIQAAPNTSPDEPMLEAYTTLGFLAATTARVRLGTAVSAATYREPALLIKAVSALDTLSGGRAWLGIGAGYQEMEARYMGLPLPPRVGERFERLEEILRLGLAMWSGDESAFEGERYRLERPISSPPPLARPHPPILIGGMGEQRTLRLVAEYADACNLFDIPDGGRTIRHKLEVLREHCKAVHRPYGAIAKSVSSRFVPEEPADRLIERLAELGKLGLDHVVLITDGPWHGAAVAGLAPVAAALGDLVPQHA